MKSIQVDLIDRAGTRYTFVTLRGEVDALWPHVSAIILAEAHKEAARMHGAVQAYYPEDPEMSLPEDDTDDLREAANARLRSRSLDSDGRFPVFSEEDDGA